MELLPVLFLIVAMAFASVGHGGASGYIAIMSLTQFSTTEIRSTALLLNILVSGIAFYLYFKKGYYKFKIAWPFIVGSIPAAFAGGLMDVRPDIFKVILAVFMTLAILRLTLPVKNINAAEHLPNSLISVLIGSVIGFFSGLIGIGGGIILSPIIIIMNWAKPKQAACISAIFIFCNSLSGMTGLLVKGTHFHSNLWLFALAVIVGAIIGAFLGSFKFSQKVVNYALCTVLTMAVIKLLLL